jgi:starch phosphorylase
VFSPDDRKRYRPLVDALRHHDFFMVCADFESYRATQRAVADLWRDPAQWWRRAILNTAGMGWFSSDRAILDYAREIWRAATLAENDIARPETG